ncbi:MAG: hypothetical protein ACLFR2_12905 [Candidatus Kapaibacterium sp.]
MIISNIILWLVFLFVPVTDTNTESESKKAKVQVENVNYTEDKEVRSFFEDDTKDHKRNQVEDWTE